MKIRPAIRTSLSEEINCDSLLISSEKTPKEREYDKAPRILLIGENIPANNDAAANEPETARMPTRDRLFISETHIPHTDAKAIPPYLEKMRIIKENNTEETDIPDIFI